MSGGQVCVCLSFDVDGLALTAAKRAQGVAIPDGLDEMMRRDQTVYLDRLIAFYQEVGAPQTVFTPARTALAERGRFRRLIRRGHEIGFHGWSHARLDWLTAKQEAEEFRKGAAAFRTAFGYRLKGMRAPSYGVSARTPDNLRAAGMIYDSSSVTGFIPRHMRRPGGGYWQIPTHEDLDDWAHCVHLPALGYHRRARPAAEVLARYKALFDECYEQGGCFTPVWHPFVTLSDRYISVARGLLAYIRSHEGVRFSTLAEIAVGLEARRLQRPIKFGASTTFA